MDDATREALATAAVARSQADETEVAIVESRLGLTRFTHNAIHQNIDSADVVARVRAVAGGRTGVVETNDVELGALVRAAAHARELALLAPADPAFAGLPHAERAATPDGAYFEATAAATPHARADRARSIFAIAERDGLWAAGYVATALTRTTIANSRGTIASFSGTDAAINVKANAADASGFAEAYACDLDSIDARAVGERAAAKARAGTAPVAVDAGAWTVILEPPAIGELLSYLADHFSAQAYDEGSSFASGALGTRAMGENVTIVDDYAEPLAVGSPFDDEGAPRRRITLVDRGVTAAIVTDSLWAARLGRENTGHALPAPNSSGPQPRNLVVAGGTQSADDLLRSTKRGLLITRFWYVRPVDRRKTIVTGMTRDGTFLIEDGAIACPVRNLRFNQSILEALCNATFSRERARTGGYRYSLVVPTTKIDGFSFSSVTNF